MAERRYTEQEISTIFQVAAEGPSTQPPHPPLARADGLTLADLQAPTGDRLRLGSFPGGATASLRLGLVTLGATAILAIANLLGGHVADMGTIAALMAGGLVLLANGALRLPGWARLRGRQMEELAAQLALPPGSTTLPESQTLQPG